MIPTKVNGQGLSSFRIEPPEHAGSAASGELLLRVRGGASPNSGDMKQRFAVVEQRTVQHPRSRGTMSAGFPSIWNHKFILETDDPNGRNPAERVTAIRMEFSSPEPAKLFVPAVESVRCSAHARRVCDS